MGSTVQIHTYFQVACTRTEEEQQKKAKESDIFLQKELMGYCS